MSNHTLDAFQRLRVSLPNTLASFQHEYSRHPLLWTEYNTGTGAVMSHLPNESSVKMDTGSSNNTTRQVRQTKVYWRYNPGLSQFVKMTYTFGAETPTNCKKKLGYFDDQNGLFLQQDSTGMSFVIRSYRTGSVVDTLYPQSQWSNVRMNSSSLFERILNPTKAQIFVIDLQWLGVGRVRFGFNVDGETIWCHEVDNANDVDGVYMTTANLPLRYELEKHIASTSQYTMKCICSAIESEGSGMNDMFELPFSIGTDATPITIGSGGYTPVIAYRMRDTVSFTGGGGSKTYRGQIHVKTIDISTKTNDISWMLAYVPAGFGTTPGSRFTGASWANYSAGYSGVEYDVSSTALSGTAGTDWFPMLSGVVAANGGSIRSSTSHTLTQSINLGKTYNGASAGDSDIIVMLAKSFTGNASVSCDLNLGEHS